MSKPSTKARELVRVITDTLPSRIRKIEAKDALLTYIADLERRAHPEGEMRELEEVDSGHMHACRIAAVELEANGFEAIPKDLRAVADALGRLLGEEGGGS